MHEGPKWGNYAPRGGGPERWKGRQIAAAQALHGPVPCEIRDHWLQHARFILNYRRSWRVSCTLGAALGREVQALLLFRRLGNSPNSTFRMEKGRKGPSREATERPQRRGFRGTAENAKTRICLRSGLLRSELQRAGNIEIFDT
jgi:hypothetical protein